MALLRFSILHACDRVGLAAARDARRTVVRPRARPWPVATPACRKVFPSDRVVRIPFQSIPRDRMGAGCPAPALLWFGERRSNAARRPLQGFVPRPKFHEVLADLRWLSEGFSL